MRAGVVVRMLRDSRVRVLGSAVALCAIAGFSTAAWFERTALPRADFVLGNGAEPESLDPAVASGTPEARVARALFEGLTILAPKTLEVVPGAAESWNVSPDGYRWTFRLRESGRWSDGSPVTASQFVASLRRVRDPKTGARYRSALNDVRDLSAPDERTIVFDLTQPSPTLPAILAMPAFSPVNPENLARDGDRWTEPGRLVSNGPFRLAVRRVRDRLRLERNEHYWNAAAVGMRTMDILATESITSLVNLYFLGDVDWITDVPQSLVGKIRREHPGDLCSGPFFATYFYRINTRHPVLRNQNVRAALDLAIDRKSIVAWTLEGGEQPRGVLVPPMFEGWEQPAEIRHDAALARRMLALGLEELGLSELPPIELLYNTSELHQPIAELVQIQWRNVLGVTCRLARQDWAAMRASVKRGDYAVARGVWTGDYLDPLTFLDVFTSRAVNNQTGFANDRYDAIVNSLARIEEEPSRRRALLLEAERLLLESHSIIPIYQYVTYNLVRPKVAGFFDNPLDIHHPQFLSWSR